MKWPLDQIKPLPTTAQAVEFLLNRRGRSLMALATLIAIAALIVGWTVKRRADREFEAARALSEGRAFAPFEKDAMRAFAGDEVKLIQSSRATRGLAQFNGSVFAATDGGLVEFDEEGKAKRRYTTLDGLPESDLTSVAVFNSKLFIGSGSQGLIVFDGKRFERYRWTDRDAQAVTVLLEDRGRLLIGTFAGGLLEFDGGRFREIKIITASGADPRRTRSEQEGQRRLAGITRLISDGARLFVGTFDDGLWVNDSDRWSHFTVVDGLPSNRVVGIVADGDQLIAATDFGLAVSDSGSSQRRFQTIATLPELSSAIRWGADILLCKDDGEIFRLSLGSAPRAVASVTGSGASLAAPRAALISPVDWKRPESLSSCQLASFVKGKKPMGETLMLLSGEGVWRLGWQDERLSGAPRVSRFGETPNLSPGALKSNVISALAFDDLGRLWVGSFRDGIDVIAPDGFP